jgi:GNAT superfamily N-acetyltransferase
MKLNVGDEINYTVLYLEMGYPPEFDWPSEPCSNIFVVESTDPPVSYFLNLYKAVGAEYEWTDKFICSAEEVNDFLLHPKVKMFTFLKNGWTAGFFVLDKRERRICDLAYFGLVPEAIGHGCGEYLLRFAIKESWAANDINLLTVNTNTLDHPNALPLYKKMGFKVIAKETNTRILMYPRVMTNK